MKFYNFIQKDNYGNGVDEAELLVYGTIGASGFNSEGVDANEVVSMISRSSASKIKIKVNSGGGSAFDGIAIYNALKQSPAKKVVYIDGQAGSAASVIAMAGDEILMPKGTFIWIHNAWAQADGEAKELRSVADKLDALNAEIAEIYSERTGLDLDTIKSMMEKETWFSADEAVTKGFATSKLNNSIDMYNYKQQIYFAGVPVDSSKVPEEIKLKAEDKKMELKDIPNELVEQLLNMGAEKERERLASIEEASIPGFEDLVLEAKADPKADGRDLSFKILQRQKKTGTGFLSARKLDAETVSNVGCGTSEAVKVDYKAEAAKALRDLK